MKTARSYIVIIIFSALFITSKISAQEVNIVPQLKEIEAGNIDEVKEDLAEFERNNPNDPSVIFLKGVLTEDGEAAFKLYNRVVDEFPNSKYADASLYRIYSYQYALGLYKAASRSFERLKIEYPNSPYIKIASRDIPRNDETIITKKDTPVPEETKEPEKYNFTIQAGAFTKEENAVILQKEFQKAGYFSEINDKVVAGTTFNVVMVGKFHTRDEAENFLQVINSEFNLDGRILEIK